MSDPVFSSGAGKVVIYYAAADGVGQRVKRPAALEESPRGFFQARATDDTRNR